MTFQTVVRLDQTAGIIGEIIYEGPERAQPGILRSADASNNVIGRAFTHLDNVDGVMVAGGTGAFAGILVNPKTYATAGASTGALDPTLILRNEEEGSFLRMGIIIVSVSNTGNIGDPIRYNNGNGTISIGEPGTGQSAIPNASITRNNITAAGLAYIEMTN